MKTTLLTAPAAAEILANRFAATSIDIQSPPLAAVTTADTKRLQDLQRFRYVNRADGVTITGDRTALVLTISRSEERLYAWILSLRWRSTETERGWRNVLVGWFHGDQPNDADVAMLAHADEQMGWLVADALQRMVPLDEPDGIISLALVDILRRLEHRRYNAARNRAIGTQRLPS